MNRRKELWKNLIPAIISNLSIFLLSAVDGVIIGQGAGMHALGAVNIAAPFVYFADACFTIACTGGAAVAAVNIGRNSDEAAQTTFSHSLKISLVAGLIVTLSGLLFSEPLSVLLGADETFLSDTKTYIFWYAVFSLPTALSVCCQAFLRLDEAQPLVAVTNVVGTVLNIILDILMVFVFKKGVFGAVIATGISEIVMFLIPVSHFVLKKGKLRLINKKTESSLIKEICYRGIPDSLIQCGTLILVATMNVAAIRFIGPVGVDAFAIFSYIASFALTVFYGAAEGLQPLLGISYGKNNESNLSYYFRSGVIFVICGSLLFILMFIIFSAPLCQLMGANGEILVYSVNNMWKFVIGLVFAGVNVMISVFLYSTEATKEALCFNLLKSVILNPAAVLLLPAVFGPGIVWYTYIIFEAVTVFVGLLIYKKIRKK